MEGFLPAGFKSIVKTLEVHFPSLGPRERTHNWVRFLRGADEGKLVRARRVEARRRSPRGLRLRSIGDTLHPHCKISPNKKRGAR